MARRSPRIFSISRSGSAERIATLEARGPADHAPRRIAQEPHDRERGDALARPGLADDAERAAGRHLERDPVDRAQLLARNREARDQSLTSSSGDSGISCRRSRRPADSTAYTDRRSSLWPRARRRGSCPRLSTRSTRPPPCMRSSHTHSSPQVSRTAPIFSIDSSNAPHSQRYS